MGNASTLFQLEALASYKGDGFQDMVRALRSGAGRHFAISDNLTIGRIATSALTDVKTNAASQVVMIWADTNSAATTTGYLHLFNTSSASVTLGTTPPEMSIKLTNAAGSGAGILMFPGISTTQFGAALSLATTVAAGTSTTAANATNAPNVIVVYA
ncbi:MAG TPA: hypothetical protein VJ816_06035 [Gemmatimonadales bacterium]|nr:hypothetical protein [Gemmatimonadales bacterium]